MLTARRPLRGPGAVAPRQPLIRSLPRSQGLVQAVGVSNYGPRQLQRIHKHLTARGVPLASVQAGPPLLAAPRLWCQGAPYLSATESVRSVAPLQTLLPDTTWESHACVLAST